MEGLSLAEFARRSDVTMTTVHRAVRAGRLELLPEGGIDPRFIGTKWHARAVEMSEPKKKRAAVKQAAKKTAAKKTSKQAAQHKLQAEVPKRKPGRPLQKPRDPNPTSEADRRAKEFADALFTKEKNLAALRELEYQQKAGAVIDVALVNRVLFDLSRADRDVLLNWPVRVAPLIASELGIAADTMTRVLVHHVHALVSALGEPHADFERATGKGVGPARSRFGGG
jgi:hypothetical protein